MMIKELVYCDIIGCKNNNETKDAFKLGWIQIRNWGSKNAGVDVCPTHVQCDFKKKFWDSAKTFLDEPYGEAND